MAVLIPVLQCYRQTERGYLKSAYESAKQAMKSAGIYIRARFGFGRVSVSIIKTEQLYEI